ncbi:cyclic nucleotide-binding domain-containing protein 2-like [Branchiostoma floridae]|uniref:Cyclic nucleotide-binding domain-containing protein 2-like n=1 Tax=Branchiostoma floridae TaxID=7739 RepID=A0A9J7L4X5_BRAFL|nr:cyclic nucleotide-binding domain-containing protein 2-like [Branchiostoma floridae]XP_035676123.1 cyclic nucleotide-binding domain-containing protein 2-like [Branchiostoma floridae]
MSAGMSSAGVYLGLGKQGGPKMSSTGPRFSISSKAEALDTERRKESALAALELMGQSRLRRRKKQAEFASVSAAQHDSRDSKHTELDRRSWTMLPKIEEKRTKVHVVSKEGLRSTQNDYLPKLHPVQTPKLHQTSQKQTSSGPPQILKLHQSKHSSKSSKKSKGLPRISKPLPSLPEKIHLEKFCRVGRLIMLLHRLHLDHFLVADEQGVIRRPAGNAASLKKDERKNEPMFDVTAFKANKQDVRVSHKTKEILSIDPSNRTTEETKHASIAVNSIIRKTIAEYPLEAQRKLTETGFYQCFGRGRVIVLENHRPEAVYFILSGQAMECEWDDAAGRYRTTGFLHMGDCFGDKAILDGTTHTSTIIAKKTIELLHIQRRDFERIARTKGLTQQEQAQVAFLGSLRFMRGWPLQMLHKVPKKMTFSYIRRGTVLVKDSTDSDWIYVIKSGSCSVLKKLQMVEPKESTPPKDEMPKIDMTIKLLKDLGQKNKKRDHHHFLRERFIDFKRRKAEMRKGSWRVRQLERPEINIDTKEETPESKDSVLKSLESIILQEQIQDDQSMTSQIQDKPVFVKIKSLNRRGVFGLVDMVFDNQPSLILVSDGAEVLTLSKKFFLDNAPVQVINKMKEDENPYPSEQEMQRSLQKHVNWRDYRLKSLHTTMRELQARPPKTILPHLHDGRKWNSIVENH